VGEKKEEMSEPGRKDEAIVKDKRREETSESSKDEASLKNKRREELSDQLKQISLKIDKEILELRKHNNMTSSMMSEKRRESIGSGVASKFKVPEHTQPIEQAERKNSAYQSRLESEPQADSKMQAFKEVPTKFPKMHFGPFNARCLLMEPPRSIIQRVEEYLTSSKVAFKEVDLFSVRLGGGELISVESIHGIGGYHIVKFSAGSALNEGVL
jgi:hypothetical protein